MPLHRRIIADLVGRLPFPAGPPRFMHAAPFAPSLELVQPLEQVGLGDRVEALLREQRLPHGGGEEDGARVAPASHLHGLLLVVLHLVRRQLDLVPLYGLHRQVNRVCK